MGQIRDYKKNLKYFEQNGHDNARYQNLWVSAKAVVGEKSILWKVILEKKKSLLSRKENSSRKNTETTVWMEGRQHNRSRSVPGSYTYVGRNTAKDKYIEFHGIPERQEQHDAIWAIRRTQV